MAFANVPRRRNRRINPKRVFVSFRCQTCEMKLTYPLTKILNKIEQKEILKCPCTGSLRQITTLIDPYEVEETIKRMDEKKEKDEELIRKGRSKL
jgi:coenzyme F420-reducing hydrogenase gamma subunit